MNKELLRKVEEKLYKYYSIKNKIDRLKNEISFLESKLNRIEMDLKNTNVKIDYYQSGLALGEKVQVSSTGSSYAEQEICREIEKLERIHLDTYKKILKLKIELEELEEFILSMDEKINKLEEENRMLLELKYCDKKSLLFISTQLNMSKTTAYRRRTEIINEIGGYEYVF